MSDKPQAGDMLPDFTLETMDGGTLTRADLAGSKAVLFFYPKDMTPGCTTEAIDFSALKGDFDKAGVRIIGISKDSAARHAKFTEKHALTVELATDGEEGLSDALGVWGEKQLYGKKFMGMIRSTYLIDGEGRILRIWPKVKVAGHAQEVLAAAQGA